MQMRLLSLLILVLMTVWTDAAEGAAVPLTGGMKITQNTSVTSGRYALDDVNGGRVQISGHDFAVDFRGARLVGAQATTDPKAFQGIGLHITDARNVTIKNADVSGCLWGVVIERSSRVMLVNCTVSHNADLPPGTVIDESGREPEDQHGGGILIRDSDHCILRQCTAQRQWDGVDVVRANDNIIEDSDCSYCGNWGLHLWSASGNTFRHNRAVWCTTGGGALFQALTGWQTYDAQAVGIDHNSNANLIADNDLRFGGDAIFIRANEGSLVPGVPVPPKNASNRNILRGNDCSFSPNNAIEVDFCDDTVIANNNCSYSHYGMWLGYSRRCQVSGNICINDTAKAIEVENGQSDIFAGNVFGCDPPRADRTLILLRQNRRDITPSGPHTFHDNRYYGAGDNPIKRVNTPATTTDDFCLNAGYTGGVGLEFHERLPDDGKVHMRVGPPLFWFSPNSKPTIQPAVLTPGKNITLRGTDLNGREQPDAKPAATDVKTEASDARTTAPVFVTVDGIPLMAQSVTYDTLTFAMPGDFWDRPAKPEAIVRVFNRVTWSDPVTIRLAWPDDGRPRIESILPATARIGDAVTLTGANLDGSGLRVLFNGKPVEVVRAAPNKLIVKMPANVVKTTRYNVIVQKMNAAATGTGGQQTQSWPITYLVHPSAPH